MTQVQETEYRTIEEEVTRYKCNGCGHICTGDEVVTLYDQHNDMTLHQCESCSELDTPVSYAEAVKYGKAEKALESIADTIGFALGASLFFLPGLLGVSRFLITGAFLDSFGWMFLAYILNGAMILALAVVLEQYNVGPNSV